MLCQGKHSPTKIFKGEEIGSSSKKKGAKKTDLSHRGRNDYDDQEEDLDDDLGGGLDSSETEEKVIRKANDAIHKNQ